MLNSLYRNALLPNFKHVYLQHSSCEHVFTIKVENSVDPDQMASIVLVVIGAFLVYIITII